MMSITGMISYQHGICGLGSMLQYPLLFIQYTRTHLCCGWEHSTSPLSSIVSFVSHSYCSKFPHCLYYFHPPPRRRFRPSRLFSVYWRHRVRPARLQSPFLGRFQTTPECNAVGTFQSNAQTQKTRCGPQDRFVPSHHMSSLYAACSSVQLPRRPPWTPSLPVLQPLQTHPILLPSPTQIDSK